VYPDIWVRLGWITAGSRPTTQSPWRTITILICHSGSLPTASQPHWGVHVTLMSLDTSFGLFTAHSDSGNSPMLSPVKLSRYVYGLGRFLGTWGERPGHYTAPQRETLGWLPTRGHTTGPMRSCRSSPATRAQRRSKCSEQWKSGSIMIEYRSLPAV